MPISGDGKLQRGLQNRHIQLIALGGAIGTGLFLGLGSTIQMAGPAVIISYAIGGLIAFLIMRQLGEMMAQEPVAGSFSNLAYKYWGDFAGFFAGWNYWFLYVLVGMSELTAMSKYVRFWHPDVPEWQTVLFFFLLINAVNLANVKLFGELEFWSALIKVAAIIGMIILGCYILLSGSGGGLSSVSNLWEYGGFFAKGAYGVFISLAIVMFSFGGLELVGIAAAEADDPQRSIPKAVNQVLYRILIFYFGAILVLLCLYPWTMLANAADQSNWAAYMHASPFVLIFRHVGSDTAAHILNFVVLTAALSVYNSSVYCNSRMLFGLAAQQNAPQIFAGVCANGVPVTALLTSSAFTMACVVLSYAMPQEALGILMSLAVSGLLLNWIMISLTHIKFRKAMVEKGENILFRAFWHPFGNYLCLIFIVLIYINIYLLGMKGSVYMTPVWIFLVWLGYRAKRALQKGA
jgi:aromatic amino acid transport protein AroP